MRFYVEPSPAGGYRVMLRGTPSPVSVHDTEEEAQERMLAYQAGMEAAEAPAAPTGEHVWLRDGSEVVVRAITAAGEESLGALDPATGKAVGVARFIRLEPGGDRAEAAVAVVDEWQGRGLGAALLDRLAARAGEAGIRSFTAAARGDAEL